jgi:hypothetical protein
MIHDATKKDIRLVSIHCDPLLGGLGETCEALFTGLSRSSLEGLPM